MKKKVYDDFGICYRDSPSIKFNVKSELVEDIENEFNIEITDEVIHHALISWWTDYGDRHRNQRVCPARDESDDMGPHLGVR